MRMTLVKEGYNVKTASSARTARQALGETQYELVVSDIYLGDASAIDLLDEIQAANPNAPIILVTAQGTVETAAAASGPEHTMDQCLTHATGEATHPPPAPQAPAPRLVFRTGLPCLVGQPMIRVDELVELRTPGDLLPVRIQ